jgi:hypothetical protein
MLCVRGGDKGPRLHRQEIVFPHEPDDSLMIDQQATPPQLCGDAPIAVPTPMRQGDLLDLVTHDHLFVQRLRFLQ